MIEIGSPDREVPAGVLDAPGGFVWWYADLLSPEGDGAVVIWSYGLPFLPGYADAARRGAPQLPRARPSVNVVGYRAGRPVVYLLQEHPSDAAPVDGEAFTTRQAIGGCRFERRTADGRVRLDVSLDCALPGTDERLTGAVRVEGVARVDEASRGAATAPSPALPRERERSSRSADIVASAVSRPEDDRRSVPGDSFPRQTVGAMSVDAEAPTSSRTAAPSPGPSPDSGGGENLHGVAAGSSRDATGSSDDADGSADDGGSPVGTIVARETEGRASSVDATGAAGAEHVWTPLTGPAGGEATLRVGRREVLRVGGRAYHDRNWGRVPLDALGIGRWIWGRVPLDGEERVLYLLEPEDGGPTLAHGLATGGDGGTRRVALTVEAGPERRALAGMRRPAWLLLRDEAGAPWLRVRPRRVSDDGPFYLRMLLEAETGEGERALGWGEVVAPARVDRGLHRPFVRMRVHRAEGGNSPWLPLFTGPREGRLGRLMRHVAGGRR